jgi:hypothetical protein
MSIEYEIPSNGNFVMEVKLIDCNLKMEQREKIFDHMKSETMLLDYLRKASPNAKIRKIVRESPNLTILD